MSAIRTPPMMPLRSLTMDVRPVTMEETRPLRQSVLRPHQTIEELAAHESDDAYAVGVFDAGALIAVGFIVEEGEPGEWRIRGMATEQEARGRGAGSAVIAALVEHARDQGAMRVWCNARVPAISLYARAGFAVESDVFEPPDIGPHVRMGRALD
jgi:GNAT superfamily N-acetyltransferase